MTVLSYGRQMICPSTDGRNTRMKKTSTTTIIQTIILCVLMILGTVFIIIAFTYHTLIDRLLGGEKWCFNDWMCNAPSKDLDFFNGKNPQACSGNCSPGEAYNIIETRVIPSIMNCYSPEALADTVTINVITGCEIVGTPASDVTTGEVPKTCGGFRYRDDASGNWKTGYPYQCDAGIQGGPFLSAIDVMNAKIFNQPSIA